MHWLLLATHLEKDPQMKAYKKKVPNEKHECVN